MFFMVLILPDIRSAHNVGSIFRTADGAGIEKIYLCGITPAPVDRFGRQNKEIAKVALGAERAVTWEKAASATTLITRLKKEGFTIIAVEQDEKSIPYFRMRISKNVRERTALVLGSEVDGISHAILKKCDTIIEIPMHGAKESLNVSVAFGIIAFHLAQ